MHKYFLLGIIVFLAFLLRVLGIAQTPPSLSWDEVSIGYNAYSILKTGQDEHGRYMPLDAFIAYGDYKPPLSVYITVPFVAVFGLNELSVRLPSAIFGSMTVLMTFFVVAELFSDIDRIVSLKKNRIDNKSRFPAMSPAVMALVSSLLLAFSPWHINLSRTGFEANIALFFVLLGIFMLLLSRKKSYLWVTAWLPFVAAIYTFNSSRYFVVIFSVFVVVYCYREILNNRRNFLVGLVLACLLLIPILPHLFSKEARLRFTEVNIFSDLSVIETSNERIAREGNTLFAKIINNRRIGFAKSFINHFLDNFQPNFLFIKGDGNPKFSTQDVGQLYLIEAPFLVAGILIMFSRYPRQALFLFFWIVSAIIPAATARETPHALRILNSLPTWQVYTAFGLLTFHTYIYRRVFTGKETGSGLLPRRIPGFIFLVIILMYGFQFTYYIYNYYVHYPRLYAAEWQYGYKQAYEYINSVKDTYDYFYISDRIGRPYMYGLFYLQYDPALFRQQKKSYFDAAGFYHVDSFGKFNFTSSVPQILPSKALVIGDPSWVRSSSKVLKKIEYPNGDIALVAFQ